MSVTAAVDEVDTQLACFGRRLQAIRRSAQLTQRELADVSGLHRVTINRLEQGTVDVGLTSLLKLSKALSVSTAILAGEG